MLAVSPALPSLDPKGPPGVRRGRIGAVSSYVVSGGLSVRRSAAKARKASGKGVVIPGCGHYCLKEAPQEILATLTAFLASYRESA